MNKTILPSIIALGALTGAALADDASRDVLPSIYALQQVPGEARQAVSPASGARDFPDRGFGTASNAAMIRDVQAASASGRFSGPSWPHAVRGRR